MLYSNPFFRAFRLRPGVSPRTPPRTRTRPQCSHSLRARARARPPSRTRTRTKSKCVDAHEITSTWTRHVDATTFRNRARRGWRSLPAVRGYALRSAVRATPRRSALLFAPASWRLARTGLCPRPRRRGGMPAPTAARAAGTWRRSPAGSRRGAAPRAPLRRQAVAGATSPTTGTCVSERRLPERQLLRLSTHHVARVRLPPGAWKRERATTTETVRRPGLRPGEFRRRWSSASGPRGR